MSFVFILSFTNILIVGELSSNVSVNCSNFVGELSPNYVSVNCLGTVHSD